MSARQAGRSAAEAKVERLVITHLIPGVDREESRIEAEKAFGSPVEMAHVGARYEV
jgi:ribonuclease BN (tRNA processing enzyme)